ncbi:hypothetical protein JCM11491_004773 [Sporobolomyces phaffii]
MQAITPQQQAILAQLQHAQATQSQSQGGVSTTLRALPDGDDQYRHAKRRKPTSLALPTSFTRLESSSASLDSLAASYRELQRIEADLDWTFSRKAVELTERARPPQTSDEGLRLDRTLRLHLEATPRDQEWQLDDLVSAASTAVPRVHVRLSGHIGDSREPFTRHYQRITIESPLLAAPISWNRPSTVTAGTFPSAIEFSIPHSLAPTAAAEPVPVTVTLYPFAYAHSPTSQLFTLVPPDLAQLLGVSECTRPEAVHALWLYVRRHSLIVDSLGSTPAGGIKTQSDTAPGLSKKYFGGADKVAWHHVGEWVNRWLGPTVPRTIDTSLSFSPSSPSSPSATVHSAFDVPVSVFVQTPATSPPSRLHTASVLSSLSSSSSSPTAPASSSSSSVAAALDALNGQIAASCVAVTRHAGSLALLAAFTADPTKFLATYLASQQSSLDQVLSPHPRGSSTTIGGGWKDALRGSTHFSRDRDGHDDGDDAWVKEAVNVWLSREHQGALLKRLHAQAQAQGQSSSSHAPHAQAPPSVNGGGYPAARR